eukprot:TRINITY_DN1062_c0_g1_i9.p1 TRINITY_DN1062_c0_g1~~TRINITY_DN1062_c0_g1_i9.p1  ORF type:complete len:414 (-),score=70.76 TRINITY_DN1062_c0_g1_i9:237-1478(-)
MMMRPTPQDKYYYVWFLCLAMGIAQLFPWNIFISSFRWLDTTFDPFPFVFWMAIPFNLINIITIAFLTVYGNKYSVSGRLFASFFVEFFMVFLIPFVNYSPWNLGGQITLSLIIVSICGVCTSTLLGTGFGVVAKLPPEYTTALMAGQGVAGLIAGLLQLIMDFAVFGQDPRSAEIVTEGLIYFSVASLIILFCTCCTALLLRSEFYLWHQDNRESQDFHVQEVLGSEFENYETVSPWGVFKKIWLDALSVFLVFFFTLSLFPGVDAILVPFDPTKVAHLNTILILLFQIGDLIGRMVPQFYVAPIQRFLWILILCRFVFYPLSFLIALPQYVSWKAPWISILLMIIFSISNGYFGTLVMMHAPSKVSQNEQQTAGTMMTFFLQMGIFLGACVAILFQHLVTVVWCDPCQSSS